MNNTNLQKYFDYLAKPVEELGGNSICPFIAKYRESIVTKETFNIVSDLHYYLNNFPQNKKIVILYNKHISAEWLIRFTDDFQKLATKKDLWVAWDHPKENNFIGEIKTNNNYYGLLLVQPLRELIDKSNVIKQTTNYYDFWTESYYKEIVEKRQNLIDNRPK